MLVKRYNNSTLLNYFEKIYKIQMSNTNWLKIITFY